MVNENDTLAQEYFRREFQYNSVAAAVSDINSAYAAVNPGARQPDGTVVEVPGGIRVPVVLNIHGLYIRNAAGEIIPHPDGAVNFGAEHAVGNNAATQAFYSAVRGKVESLFIVGCGVAEGLNPDPADNHLMEHLATGLKSTLDPTQTVTVVGYDTAITLNRPGRGARFFGRPYYWSKHHPDGHKVSVTR